MKTPENFCFSDAVKEENLKLQNKIQKLVEKLSWLDPKDNNLDQNNRWNNLEIQGTPAIVPDEK